MISNSLMARILRLVLRLRHPFLSLRALGKDHRAEAIELLSLEFSRREPLCRTLGVPLADIQPFFAQIVDQVIANQMGVVALNRRGDVVGVVTNEDHFDRMEPIGQVAEGLNTIGAYLDSIPLPSEWQPAERGVLFHSGLAAIRSGTTSTLLLPWMSLEIHHILKKRGYQGGYAKVTNPVIIRRFQMLERFANGSVFRCLARVKPAEFQWEGQFPFAKLRTESCLYAWLLP
jgi:hypothetical protein